MTGRFTAYDAYVEEHQNEFIRELQAYCKTPCITGQGVGVRESAELTAGVLRSHGIRATVMETGGAPVVYGELGEGERTLLIYDHYDVQPPEPLELWESDPFGGEIRDGKVFARGVDDNRGDAMARAQAIATTPRHSIHGTWWSDR
jgi:acetylornithine deacetylase/succinyl-diaminopimelate desuccinylase-like protein